MLTLSVVSHGQGLLLDRLLTQLDRQPSLADVQVVVTLNLADEPFDASRYPRLSIVALRNAQPRGFGANHNAAFRFCQTTWFGVLNPDLTLPDGEPFTQLMLSGATAERVAAIAPRIVNARGQSEDSVRANLTPWSLAARQLFGRRKAVAVQGITRRGEPFFWLAGMCLLLDAAAFRSIGGFDERFFLYCEDFDLCARLYNANYAIKLEPRTRLVHEAQRNSHRSLRHLRWHLVSLAKVWTSAAFWRVTLTLT